MAMLKTTLFSLMGVTSAGQSASKEISFITADSNKVSVNYYTSMSEMGGLVLNFKASIDKIYSTPADSNPRFCLALREVGQTDWDIAQMSMISDNNWSAKDGMSSNAVNWCSAAWAVTTGQAEASNDWIVAQEALNYDANLKTLRASFKRNLIGTNDQDYTFKVGTDYEYTLIYGNWVSPTDGGTSKAQSSAVGKINILPATFDGNTSMKVAGTLVTLAAMASIYL